MFLVHKLKFFNEQITSHSEMYLEVDILVNASYFFLLNTYKIINTLFFSFADIEHFLFTLFCYINFSFGGQK